jgi:hypothetical protein
MIINKNLIEETPKSKEEYVKEYIEKQYETIEIAKPYVDKMKNGIQEAIKLFEEGKNNEAVEICSFIEEGSSWLSEVARLTKDIQSKNLEETELDSKIDELAEAYENEDYTLMSDLLQYEILPIIIEWEKVITAVQNIN